MYLAIESSCDETSIAILDKPKKEYSKENFLAKIEEIKVVSSVISSQIEVHKKYGGVIPEIGAREHAKNIYAIFDESLKQARISKIFFLENLEGIFVTNEPGLFSALQVGLEFAKIVKFWVKEKTNKEVEINLVNHLHGHVSSCFFNHHLVSSQNFFPHLHLLVSGGNTQLMLLESWSKKNMLGQTLDDAAGECLDKIGRMLGFPYPGGVWVAKIAKEVRENKLNLPIGMQKNSKSLDFSYSGLKTSVRYLIQSQKFETWVFERKLSQAELNTLLELGSKTDISQNTSDYLRFIYEVCVSAQFVVIAQLVNSIKRALKRSEVYPKSVGISGGVSANLLLRNYVHKLFSSEAEVFLPPKNLTGDNALMIGIAGILDIS